MITAVDTSILLDVFKADITYGPHSKNALRRCLREGRVIACEVVFAEVSCAFGTGETAQQALRDLGIEFDSFDIKAAIAAGETFRVYRARGGSREQVIADFLIGAHAQSKADRLLTRDRGFHRSYFSNLKVIDPTER